METSPENPKSPDIPPHMRQTRMVAFVRPPSAPSSPSEPVTWADFHNLFARVQEALELIHQVNYFGFVLAETLIERGAITRADLVATQTRLQRSASEITTKVTFLRSAPLAQKEKVYQAIPFRIRPEDLSIPLPEFMKHIKSYLKENQDQLTMGSVLDILLFYGLPRTVYEQVLKEREEFFIPGQSGNPRQVESTPHER